MLAQDEAFERSRRDAEEDDREDAAVRQHYELVTGADPEELLSSLSGARDHCEEASARLREEGARDAANFLQHTANGYHEAFRAVQVWFAKNTICLDESESEQRLGWGDR